MKSYFSESRRAPKKPIWFKKIIVSLVSFSCAEIRLKLSLLGFETTRTFFDTQTIPLEQLIKIIICQFTGLEKVTAVVAFFYRKRRLKMRPYWDAILNSRGFKFNGIYTTKQDIPVNIFPIESVGSGCFKQEGNGIS